MATANLNLPDVSASQNQKEVTINEQAELIDRAFGDGAVIQVDDTNAASIGATVLRESFFFTLSNGTPVPTAAITITIVAGVSRGAVTFINDTSFDATVTIASQPVTAPIVPAGATKILVVGDANVREPEAGASLTVEDESVAVVTDANALDFQGAGVSVADAGAGKATVTIPGGGGSGLGGALPTISPQFRGAYAYQNATTSLPTGATTQIPLQTEFYDTDSIHDNVTNNSRLTVPSGVTRVRLVGQIDVIANASNERQFSIRKNGAGGTVGFVTQNAVVNAIVTRMQVESPVIEVTAGDYFELQLGHNAGVALTSSGNSNTWLAMEIVETIDSTNLQAVAVGTRPRFGGAVAVLTATESVGTGSTAIPWDQVTLDTDSIWSAGTPTRLTVPENVTKVRLRGAILWDDTTNVRFVRITKNGVASADVPRADNNDNRAGDQLTSQVINVVPGDYFELEGSSNIVTNAITNSFFEMEIVERAGATDFPTGFIAIQPKQKGALLKLDTDTAIGATLVPTDWDSAVYDTAFDPGDGGLPQRFWLGPDLTVTFNGTTDEVTGTAHGMVTGEGPFEFTTTGTFPTGVTAATKYWAAVVDANTFQLATSRANAIGGTVVSFTGNGTPTTTMERADRIVTPAGVNKLRITFQAFTAATVSRILMELEKEGSPNFAGNPAQVVDTAAANERINGTSADLEVVEGDVFKVLNFAGEAVNLEGNDARTWVSVVVVEEDRPLAFPGVTVERPHLGALVDISAAQSVPNAVFTALNFDQEGYDTGHRGVQFHDTVTNNSRLTVPAGVTKVRLKGAARFDNASLVGRRRMRIDKNGVANFSPGTPTVGVTAESANDTNLQVFSEVLEVVSGDYFELLCWQDSGGNLNIDSVGNDTWFGMEVVETEDAAFPPEQAETTLIADGAAVAINSIYYKKVAARRFSLNDDLSGSAAHAGTAPTVTTQVFDVKRNGTNIGTVTFGIGSQTATFATTGAGQEDFEVGDRLTIETNATVNTVIRDVAINLLAFRT